MTYRTIDAHDWIARQPKTVREAGEARGKELIREVTLREVREAVKRTQVEVADRLKLSCRTVQRILERALAKAQS